jgi:hypothetical protein
VKRSAAWLGVVWLGSALPVMGAVPSPERIAEAVAAENQTGKRGQALRLELRVQIGDRAEVARGFLITDPAGFAVLELRGANGLVERHLLRQGQTRVTRNGERLDAHRFFLPPLYLLQAEDGKTLREGLEALDVLTDRVGLAECGDEDCLVLGDVGRAIPRRGPPPIKGLELYEETLALGAEKQAAESAGMTLEEWQEIDAAQAEGPPAHAIEGLAQEGALSPELEANPISPQGPASILESAQSRSPEQDLARPEPLRSALWVDRQSFAIRGIDSSDGTRTRLGPRVIYNGVQIPSWIYIEEPGKEVVRLHVLEVSPATPDPEAFELEWFELSETPPTNDSAEAPISLPPG